MERAQAWLVGQAVALREMGTVAEPRPMKSWRSLERDLWLLQKLTDLTQIFRPLGVFSETRFAVTCGLESK